MINDAHCHFFSTKFFSTLSQQRGKGDAVAALCTELELGRPRRARRAGGPLGQRARRPPGDARRRSSPACRATRRRSAAAVARHPTRFVGYFMVNAAAPDAVARTHAAVYAQRLRCLCLFPAMHHTPLDDERVKKVIDAAAGGDAAVFVHCGQLSVGVRRALGLPSPFDLRLGDPLDVARLAVPFPTVPFIVPHFGAGLLREALMAADACPNIYLDTSSSNRWIRFTPGLTLRRRLPRGAGRRRARDGYSSAPTRRTSRAAGSGASTRSSSAALDRAGRGGRRSGRDLRRHVRSAVFVAAGRRPADKRTCHVRRRNNESDRGA